LTLLKGTQNVVQSLDCYYTRDQHGRIIQNSLLEYCDGSFENLLRESLINRKYIEVKLVKHCMKQLF